MSRWLSSRRRSARCSTSRSAPHRLRAALWSSPSSPSGRNRVNPNDRRDVVRLQPEARREGCERWSGFRATSQDVSAADRRGDAHDRPDHLPGHHAAFDESGAEGEPGHADHDKNGTDGSAHRAQISHGSTLPHLDAGRMHRAPDLGGVQEFGLIPQMAGLVLSPPYESSCSWREIAARPYAKSAVS